jgi:hypothetical protein
VSRAVCGSADVGFRRGRSGATRQPASWLAGWLTIAGRLERDLDVNITRQGVVWLPVVALGPGEHALVKRIAEASLALYQDLLELGG